MLKFNSCYTDYCTKLFLFSPITSLNFFFMKKCRYRYKTDDMKNIGFNNVLVKSSNDIYAKYDS